MRFVNVADLRDPDDPQGRTYRQVNADKTHSIPVGSLVEITSETVETNGVRLFVVYHGRDCDRTPLYWLSPYPDDVTLEDPRFMNRKWIGGYSEGGLTVIRPPAPRSGDTGP